MSAIPVALSQCSTSARDSPPSASAISDSGRPRPNDRPETALGMTRVTGSGEGVATIASSTNRSGPVRAARCPLTQASLASTPCPFELKARDGTVRSASAVYGRPCVVGSRRRARARTRTPTPDRLAPSRKRTTKPISAQNAHAIPAELLAQPRVNEYPVCVVVGRWTAAPRPGGRSLL